MAKKDKKLTKKSEEKQEEEKPKKEAKSKKDTKSKKDEKPKKEAKSKKEEKKAKEPKKKPEELLEEELAKLSEKEIENFQIEGLDMEKLKTSVLNLVANREDGMFQSELWKKLKLSSRDGSRLALKLERHNLIKREKILENGRWTYKLKIVHVPVSTQSIESAPCLICPVEQKCTLEGEVSPRTCPLIEQWVLTELSTKKTKK